MESSKPKTFSKASVKGKKTLARLRASQNTVVSAAVEAEMENLPSHVVSHDQAPHKEAASRRKFGGQQLKIAPQVQLTTIKPLEMGYQF